MQTKFNWPLFFGATIEAILALQNCVGIQFIILLMTLRVKQLIITGVDGGKRSYTMALAERLSTVHQPVVRAIHLNS